MGWAGAPPSPTGRADARTAELQSLLSVLQLSDSAFPSGRYTLSHGLEALAQHGHLAPPAEVGTMTALLTDTIRCGVGPSDAVALAWAHRTVSADGGVDFELLAAVDRRLTAVKVAREARDASTRTGRAVLATATAAIGAPVLATFAERIKQGSPGNHAVVVGMLTPLLGIPLLEAVVGDLYAFASSWTAAALRLGLLDHRSAQSVLHRVRGPIVDAALEAVEREVRQISSCTPLLDVMAMRHEQAEVRLFAT